jgi:hypothetical protein
MAFHLTTRQLQGLDLLGADQTHTMLFGGSRSGKTFLICRTIFYRALSVPQSRHLIARFRLVDVEGSVVHETIPKMMELCYPHLVGDVVERDRYFEFPNGSEVWWAGLDDKDRTEKILGKEFATTFLNECSQIPWNSRNLVVTRLAQKTSYEEKDALGQPTGVINPGLRLKAYYDENPPLNTHWSYKVFIEKVQPDTGKMLPEPGNYNSMLMNPIDNIENLDPQYLKELDALPERMRKRFKDGRFGEAGEGALWTDELLEQQRIRNELDLPEMQRIVIGVDPSGARDITDITRDEIGIVVVGLGIDGKGYVLEDLTIRGAPEKWGRVVVEAYRRWGADRVIAETNFGGAMVASVIKAAAAAIAIELGHEVRIAFSEVTASRGKVVRAEPVSTLYEGGMIWHVDGLTALEAEMTSMTIAGYLGDRSPNRVDACVWAITALFHTIAKAANSEKQSRGTATPVVQRGYSNIKITMGGRSNVGLPQVNRGRSR